VQILQRKAACFIKFVVIFATILFTGSAASAQTARTAQQPPSWPPDPNKYPGLLNEFGALFAKLQHNIQFPSPRSDSRLLPLLPQSTMFFAAFPNYADVSDQALKILRQEVRESPVFRDWWTHGDMAANGPKLEDALEKFSQLNQYLGDEIALSVATDGKEPSVLVVAEVRKPGVKKYLEQLIQQPAGNSKSPLRVLDQQELTAAKDSVPAQGPVVLVRSDFVVAATSLAILRGFNSRLSQGNHEFAATPFGQRAAQEYRGGVTVLAAADLQKVKNQAPPDATQNAAFQHSGFADMKYLVWDHKVVAGKPVSQFELSFTAPRHGAAAWLAKPTSLGSLDFVSPDAMVAAALVLTNPAQIFDDVKDLASLSNPNAFAALPVFEQALHLSLKDDVLGVLRGDLTLELDSAAPPQPVWRAILGVKDTNRLQQTLNTLMTSANFRADQLEDGGVTYYTVRIPTPKAVVPIGYAFVDGYWVLGSSRDVVAEAVRLHRSGGSLAKSKKLLASLPPGQSLNASGLLYEDPVAVTALSLQQAAPELAQSLAQSRKDMTPAAVWLYGEETTIREVSTNSAFDAGGVLIAAAIAIPNLMRSKMAANEASAIGAIRTVNTAQAAYSAAYPQKGYAPNLAALGPDPRGTAAVSPDHANLLDETLANPSCTSDAGCTKSGFRFKIAAVCAWSQCQEYAAYATPVDSNSGARNFCSTSAGVIRAKAGPPWAGPLTVPECKTWPPVQ